MDDEVLVRVGHGCADFAEQIEPLLVCELMAVAIGRKRLALDVFHDEVGQAVVGRAAIDQPRDVRMIELRQNLALVAEAAQDVVRIEPALDELDRDFLPVLVVGHGPRDRRRPIRRVRSPA